MRALWNSVVVVGWLCAAVVGCASSNASSASTTTCGDAGPFVVEPYASGYCASGSLGCADDTSSDPVCVDGKWTCERGVPWSSCGPCRGQAPHCADAGSYACCDPNAGWACRPGFASNDLTCRSAMEAGTSEGGSDSGDAGNDGD